MKTVRRQSKALRAKGLSMEMPGAGA